MKFNQHPLKCLPWASLMLAGFVLSTQAQIASVTEPYQRAQNTEVYGIGQFLSSSDINATSPGGSNVKIKMADTGLGGFGLAYHFSDHFSVRGDFMFGSATFEGNEPIQGGGTLNVKQNAFIQTGRLNLDYNIINRRITPFVTAGIGYQYLETTLQNASPVTGCYWNPWWGWVCYQTKPSAWETDFAWNAGAGLRWNINDNLFVKATAGATGSEAADLPMQRNPPR
jgi:opacity protein-like surface antigen